jgi:type I restriction enzyme S subunit
MVVNQKCIRDHEVNFELARFHDESKKAVNPERLIKVGDVLINSTGTGTLGRTAQVRTRPIRPATVDTHVTIARPKQSWFYTPFFGYGLIRCEADFVASSTGTSGQTELNRKVISANHFIPIPPLEEQERIVRELDSLVEMKLGLETKYQSELDNLKELRQSILEQAFEGKLTEPVAA